jgi:hypothetical protein
MTMLKFGTMGLATLLTAILCAAVGGAWAADVPNKQVIPNFAPTDKTGWVLDRAMGPDDLVAPPTGGPGPVTFDKAHPYYPNGRGPRSTYRVADLTSPILQPWTLPSMKKANDEVLAGKVPFRARERCWPVGVPGFDAYSPIESFFFYQMPDKVAIIAQRGPEIRHVYLNVSHSKDVKPSWYGESVGHYENGDTLVIDTIGLSAKSYIDNYRTPHTDQLHVVERLKLAADGKSIDVLAYVEDPGAFTTPYTAVQRWLRVENAPIETDQCNENNGDFFSQGLVPLPQADKSDF